MPFVGSMHGGMELAGETDRRIETAESTGQRVYMGRSLAKTDNRQLTTPSSTQPLLITPTCRHAAALTRFLITAARAVTAL